ncbi:MAG TPA: 3-dehydroquinate synthase II [Candidatus Lokiarchaeia archaeon]|nr:3-dehydroquinate synthase II [Candidatus Lokiarchaeia archaeon]
MKEKMVILEIVGDWDSTKPFYIEAITAGFTTFVLRDATDVERIRMLGKVEIVSPDASIDPEYVFLDDMAGLGDENVLNIFLSSNLKKCVMLSLGSKEEEERVLDLVDKGVDLVLVEATDWKVIPLENLIAGFQKKNALLCAKVKDIDEARLFFETLQVGVDGVYHVIDATEQTIESFDFAKWKGLVSAMEKVDMVTVEISRIEDVGSGDRVCVDTISMLSQGEGMLIGNHARGFFLVHGEIADTEFVNARPFRVNAGAVHSYTLRAGNKTAYLSELKAGEPVMIVDWQGHTRATRVGRVKIETRPMLLVEGTSGNETISAIIQNAETICLVNEDGKQISVSKLQLGNKVMAHLTGERGRHFGKNIEENIIEK